MAELADALDSGSSGRKAMGVQVPPSAPTTYETFRFFSFATWCEIRDQILAESALKLRRDVHWTGERISEASSVPPIVPASWDKTARLWDAGTGRMITDPLRHGAELHLALFSTDGRRTVTADAVGAVWIWDVERGTLVVGPMRHPQPSGFTASVGVAFDQEGRRVATVEREGSIQLWDAQTGQPIGQRFGHVHPGLSGAAGVAFSPDGLRVATVTADSTLRLWDATTGYALGVPLTLASAKLACALQWERSLDCGRVGERGDCPGRRGGSEFGVAGVGASVGGGLAGKRFDQNGALVGATRSLTELRDELLSLKGDDFWSRLGRWFTTGRSGADP